MNHWRKLIQNYSKQELDTLKTLIKSEPKLAIAMISENNALLTYACHIMYCGYCKRSRQDKRKNIRQLISKSISYKILVLDNLMHVWSNETME